MERPMLFTSLLRSVRLWSTRTSIRWPRWHFVPKLTVLEDRTVPSTFVVSNVFDSGPGSLRDTIDNKASSGDTIGFDHNLDGKIITLSAVSCSSTRVLASS